MTKAPNPIDKHVGARVRMRRLLIGMSQEKLGEALGLTFQQVQKYEKGTNRIGASRLHHIASTLGVGIDYFYEGAPTGAGEEVTGFAEGATAPSSPDLLSPADSVQLMRAFRSIENPKLRRRIVDLVTAIAGDPAES